MIINKDTKIIDGSILQEGVIFLIDKPLHWTSFDVVNKIRFSLKKNFLINKIKVGHAGTLDPLATGLVVLAAGKMTKKIDSFLLESKEYIAEIKFGKTTQSFDAETTEEGNYKTEHITEQTIRSILQTNFSGTIQQTPPLFSAKSKDGVRAYVLARRGENITLPPQTITIHEIEILNFASPLLTLKINCSKGTYIRSIANDLGIALESGAYLTKLTRTRSGNFENSKALTIEECLNLIQLSATNNCNNDIIN
ncbi:MAG: tRNA pseudouridine(55) synthase TruB [Bacteroidales bacterium]|nr:tRNA pseudouridine(55) synthase TruB [Bacteroidales bacterium]